MFYLEILEGNKGDVKPGIYTTKLSYHPWRDFASRVWFETEKGTVWRAEKHRRTETLDPKSMFWLKLKARAVCSTQK